MVTLNDKCPNCNNNLIAMEGHYLNSHFHNGYYDIKCIECDYEGNILIDYEDLNIIESDNGK